VIEFVCESGASENRADAALIAESRNALADLLDGAELAARLVALNSRMMAAKAMKAGGDISLHDALEHARADMARERGGKERG
jgi:hypothetical protein